LDSDGAMSPARALLWKWQCARSSWIGEIGHCGRTMPCVKVAEMAVEELPLHKSMHRLEMCKIAKKRSLSMLNVKEGQQL
jgi:hypothetical protein